MWNDKQDRIDELEEQANSFRRGIGDLKTQLNEAAIVSEGLRKAYQEQAASLVQLRADLADAEVGRDYQKALADERYDCMAALTDENADLVYHKRLLTLVLKACHIQVPKLPARKADGKK